MLRWRRSGAGASAQYFHPAILLHPVVLLLPQTLLLSPMDPAPLESSRRHASCKGGKGESAAGWDSSLRRRRLQLRHRCRQHRR
ncbi:hypothetical protein BDA96_01G467000 [Sorghum bicolor]|uniref:Uncharacterized protein n=2 Tax=Sorghum bicolor TaxID=4558 RepID=A0A921S5R7_SORBI|nr:hypothetical protein BDA96_01G467000 [Sorghum bicolor]KXG39783.1 hypothetical protein SORBI_3001G438900 [Sorghum bicolor]